MLNPFTKYVKLLTPPLYTILCVMSFKISHMFINNKYTKCYLAIIQSANTITRTTYTETHHIIPRSMGGTDDKSNLVQLSAREHFICHKLLVKMVTEKLHYHKMLCAVAYFSNNTNRQLQFSSRDIEYLRQANSIASSARNKGNQHWLNRAQDSPELKKLKSTNAAASKWVNNGTVERFTKEYDYYISSGYTFGRLPFSAEWVDKIKAGAPKTFSEERNRKLSATLKGRPKSTEHRQKISNANKQRKKITCEYCLKEVDPLNYTRWHGANCKVNRAAST